MRIQALVVSLLLCASLSAQELYIVPVYGDDLPVSDGLYTSTLTAINLTNETATLTLRDALPLVTTPCGAYCAPSPITFTIPPSATDSLGKIIPARGEHLLLGALVFEADHPIELGSSVLHLRDGNVRAESVEIARSWIPAETEAMIPLALYRGEKPTANLFLVNPNDAVLTVSYRAMYGEGTATVAPRSTSLVPLPFTFYCPARCAYPAPFVPDSVFVSADAPFMAAVSSRVASASVVRIARPLPQPENRQEP